MLVSIQQIFLNHVLYLPVRFRRFLMCCFLESREHQVFSAHFCLSSTYQFDQFLSSCAYCFVILWLDTFSFFLQFFTQGSFVFSVCIFLILAIIFASWLCPCSVSASIRHCIVDPLLRTWLPLTPCSCLLSIDCTSAVYCSNEVFRTLDGSL